jgi:hypothetical protein
VAKVETGAVEMPMASLGLLVTVKAVRLILEEAAEVMTTGLLGHRIMPEDRVL